MMLQNENNRLSENGVGSSETTRVACYNKTLDKEIIKRRFANDTKFAQWLAGKIDGDGCLLVSKAGYTSCEITTPLDSVKELYYISHLLGGSVTLRKGVKAYRWRLHNTPGMRDLIGLINGRLQVEKRQKQLDKVCYNLKIEVCKEEGRETIALDSSWVSGFFSADGHFNVNINNYQLSIAIGQKDPSVLYKIVELFGGNVWYDKSWKGFLYSCSSQKDLEVWFTYFAHNPLKCFKAVELVRFKRLNLFKTRKYHTIPEYKPRFFRLVKSFIKKNRV